LVKARSQTCPSCTLTIPSTQVPLICQCCRAQYHKIARCSGLTPGALNAWKRSKHWECNSCINTQARDAVNDPEIVPVSSRGNSVGDRRGLRVLQWNVDGIGTAIADVLTLVKDDPGLDVLLLQETKLVPANLTPTIPGYTAIRRDRPADRPTRGGGLLTYVKADIPFRQVPAYRREEVADGLEALAVEIQRGVSLSLLTYIFPPSGREFRVVSTQGRLGYRLPNSSLGATSMHTPPSGMTPNPEMSLEPSWRTGFWTMT